MAAPKNPAGYKSEKPWRDALLRAVKRHAYGTGGPRQLEHIADTVVTKAAEGDITAAKEIGDRLDGKSIQGVALEVQMQITEIKYTIVHPGDVIEGECEVIEPVPALPDPDA